MKRIAALIVLLTVALLASSCTDPGAAVLGTARPEFSSPAPTAKPEKITDATDYVTAQWVAVEIPFTASEAIRNIDEAELDVTFTNRSTGTRLVMPAFWNGKTDWLVRFAPTECGIWDFVTAASGKELGLNGLTGTLAANPYEGELAIYQHGFVKTVKDTRYFVYDDGTPFFYLGDTHWTMPTEEFDDAGPNAGTVKTDSHFKTIVDKRVEQGFTVYQSEPIGASFNATDGIGSADIPGFMKLDRYFQYIAEKGLVHANAELTYPSGIAETWCNHAFLRAITRCWVARYAAYPVLWTLGQEVDNGSNFKKTYLTFVYKDMCAILHETDPYQHPITGHQLNAATVTAGGDVAVSGCDYGSDQYDPAKGERTGKTIASTLASVPGHSWFGAQWRPTLDRQFNQDIPRDYWENGGGKVTINYEARYDHLYTKEFGARAAGWISFLSGMYGYGYGAADIWYYRGNYAGGYDGFDGVDTVTVQDKKTTWSEMIQKPINDQLGLMRSFFESFPWYNLIPDFDNRQAFAADDSVFYAAAHNGNSLYVVYFYHPSAAFNGRVLNMDPRAVYTARWFDPRTGEYTVIDETIRVSRKDPSFTVTEKPSAEDFVLVITKNQ